MIHYSLFHFAYPCWWILICDRLSTTAIINVLTKNRQTIFSKLTKVIDHKTIVILRLPIGISNKRHYTCTIIKYGESPCKIMHYESCQENFLGQITNTQPSYINAFIMQIIVMKSSLILSSNKWALFRLFVCLFCCFTSQVNSYGHCGTVSSPNNTFSWASLNKRLTSKSCAYFPL